MAHQLRLCSSHNVHEEVSDDELDDGRFGQVVCKFEVIVPYTGYECFDGTRSTTEPAFGREEERVFVEFSFDFIGIDVCELN